MPTLTAPKTTRGLIAHGVASRIYITTDDQIDECILLAADSEAIRRFFNKLEASADDAFDPANCHPAWLIAKRE